MKRHRYRLSKQANWYLPLAYVLVTLLLGMVLPRLEHHFLPGSVSTMSAAAAMSVCASIASGMLALTGIVFSLAFVMVQFSATAYSPRLVLWVARDPVVSHALGVFSATFLYSLLFLAWVDREGASRVPLLSGWLVFGLLLASLGLFIALIERIGGLQVNRMLSFTGDRGRDAIEELYPDLGLAADKLPPAVDHGLPCTQTLVHRGAPQAIQAINFNALVQLAEKSGAVLEMGVAVGDTVLERTQLVRVCGASQPLDEAALRFAIKIGEERTFEQDPKYAIRLVVDIAIKALSPAINDPTTAVQALDQIEDLLLRLGSRRLESGVYSDSTGKVRLIVPSPTWEDYLRLALDEIRAYGADSVQVMRRMTALIKNLAAVLPEPRRAALRHWEKRVEGSIARTFEDLDEKRDASVADRQGLGVGQANTEERRSK